jgi:hypothetical protein
MISIRPGTDSDKPQILKRIEEIFGTDSARRTERLWDWQWRQDPRLPGPGYQGIVAEWDGQLIGSTTTIPAGLYIAGQPVQAWWNVDGFVHWGLTRRALREHKRSPASGAPDLSRGIAAAMLNHPGTGPVQLHKHNSDAIMPILERIGYKAHPNTGSFHRRISLRHPLDRSLGTVLGGITSAVADLTLPRIPRPTLPIEPFDGPFDSRFDALWNKAKHQYPAICRRDSVVLDWRYRRHPDADYRVLILDSGSGLRGYSVIKVFDRGRCRRGKIVDLLTAPGDEPALRSLAAGALRELRQCRVERVECFACGTGHIGILAALGFTPRLTKSQHPQPLMTRHLPAEAERIYVTQGDGDGG